MRRSVVRSPYFWTMLAVAGVVTVAWIGRESYQPIIPGSVAPEFTYEMIDVGPRSLSDYAGKVVLVNVWATWCGPCVTEMPSMQRLYESLEGEDFEILAVSVDARVGETDATGNPGGDLRAFADELGLTFPILHDPEGRINGLYQTTGVPESFVIDPSGVIVRKVSGPTEWDASQNEELIRRLLAS